MVEPARFAKPIQRPEDFTGQEPEGLPTFLAKFAEGTTFFQGTGIQVLGWKMSQLPSGLIVPHEYAATPAPIDQFKVYLTTEELFGKEIPKIIAIDNLSRIPALGVIAATARVFSTYRKPGISHEDVDAKYAQEFFVEPMRTKVINLLRDRTRSLIVPQALLAVVKDSMHCSGDSLLPGVEHGNYVAALLITADHLGSDRDRTEENFVLRDVPGSLGREMIANQIFNTETEEAHSLGRFIRTWLQMPKELAADVNVVDLEKAYFDSTGVPLLDVVSITLALWAASVQDKPVLSLNYFINSTWKTERVQAAIAPISATLPDFRGRILEEAKSANNDWSFDTFNRYPVVRGFDEEIIVIDPQLLVNRVFGWLPVFDIQFGLPGRDKPPKKSIDRALSTVRHLAELYTAEVLDSIAGGGGATTKRVFHDQELKNAFQAEGVKIADAAIDYGDAWVVIETTTIQLKRASAKGESDEAFIADLTKLLGEVEQIDSTIKSLKSQEDRLTGSFSQLARKYFPLLILTEGFPVNPISLTLLRQMIQDAGLLQGEDVAALEVVDIVELELIESLQEEGGPSLREVLEKKQTAHLWRMRVKDFILIELKLNTNVRSRRVKKLFDEAFKVMLAALFPNGPALPEENSESLIREAD